MSAVRSFSFLANMLPKPALRNILLQVVNSDYFIFYSFNCVGGKCGKQRRIKLVHYQNKCAIIFNLYLAPERINLLQRIRCKLKMKDLYQVSINIYTHKKVQTYFGQNIGVIMFFHLQTSVSHLTYCHPSHFECKQRCSIDKNVTTPIFFPTDGGTLLRLEVVSCIAQYPPTPPQRSQYTHREIVIKCMQLHSLAKIKLAFIW